MSRDLSMVEVSQFEIDELHIQLQDANERIKMLEGEYKALEVRLYQAMGALGHPIPGNIPEGNFTCGLCEAKARRMIELEAHKVALVEVIRILNER